MGNRMIEGNRERKQKHEGMNKDVTAGGSKTESREEKSKERN
jgi:hypothetical protein